MTSIGRDAATAQVLGPSAIEEQPPAPHSKAWEARPGYKLVLAHMLMLHPRQRPAAAGQFGALASVAGEATGGGPPPPMDTHLARKRRQQSCWSGCLHTSSSRGGAPLIPQRQANLAWQRPCNLHAMVGNQPGIPNQALRPRPCRLQPLTRRELIVGHPKEVHLLLHHRRRWPGGGWAKHVCNGRHTRKSSMVWGQCTEPCCTEA